METGHPDKNDFTAYHPHYTYTFEGINHNNTNNKNIFDRPMLAKGVMKLFKEDIKINYFRNKKQMKIVNPHTLGKSGIVVFSFHDMPHSQDTKTIFSSFVILRGSDIDLSGDIYNSLFSRTPQHLIMCLENDGYLHQLDGPINMRKLQQILRFGKYA